MTSGGSNFNDFPGFKIFFETEVKKVLILYLF